MPIDTTEIINEFAEAVNTRDRDALEAAARRAAKETRGYEQGEGASQDSTGRSLDRLADALRNNVDWQ